MDQTLLPAAWYCPVCVGRNWPQPLFTAQTPPEKLRSASKTPIPLPPAPFYISQENQSTETATEDLRVSHQVPSIQQDHLEKQDQGWPDVQYGKQGDLPPSGGYILDTSSDVKFIGIGGSGYPATSLTTVLQHCDGVSTEAESGNGLGGQGNTDAILCTSPEIPLTGTRTPERERGKRIPSRKRSKYSSLPKDIEKALDLVLSHLGDMTQLRKSKEGIENRSRDLEQEVKIQEGKVRICRQELQALSQRLAEKVSMVEELRAKNAEYHKQLADARTLADSKDAEMKNWRNILHTMITTREDYTSLSYIP